MTNIDWDEADTGFDGDAYEASMKRYTSPVTKHECDNSCRDTLIPYYHEMEDLFDDFSLSKRSREVMRMDIIRARGRDNKERTLIRMFQGAKNGLFYLRMSEVSNMTNSSMGDITFETREDLHEYYNYAIDICGFDKSLKVFPNPDPLGLFEAPDDEDEDDDLFGGLDDDLFDFEDEDDDLFADDDDEGLFD